MDMQAKAIKEQYEWAEKFSKTDFFPHFQMETDTFERGLKPCSDLCPCPSPGPGYQSEHSLLLVPEH